MIKFVDMTHALRASDLSAPPTCAFLNTETGRFCEHGGTGEHLFTSADDVTRHGPPGIVTMPAGFFGMRMQWAALPQLCLVCDADGDYAIKHTDDGGEFVGWNGGTAWSDSRNRSSWTERTATGWGEACPRDDEWTIVAVNLRGDETAAELRALAGIELA